MCRTVPPRSIGAGERVLSVAGPIVGNVMTSGVGSQAGRDAGPATRDDAWPQARPDTVPEAGSDIVQGVLDGLARPLAETDFVIVDLETTGGSLDDAAITEIAAVRTRFGEREETSPVSPNGPCSQADREFATLVNPGRAIPPHVAALTGITDALVTSAPRVEDVLPRFIEFAAGCVLVAHNAPFDIGFLTAACAQHQVPWPALPTLDTAALARRVLTTDEVRDCRLATLARYFGATTRPSHRALDDARATAAVLHGLIDRLASRGVHTLEELRGFAEPSAPQRRRMRQLTATVPRAPGVCLFTGADGRVLHVVKSSDMHARACGYFAAAENRRSIREMIDKTTRIVAVRCTTALEAEVAEIRLIAEHLPPCDQQQGDQRQGEREPPHSQTAAPGHVRPAAAGHGGHAAPAQAPVLAAVPQVVAARPRFSGGWDVAWIRYGSLERTAVLPPGAAPPAEAGDADMDAAAPCTVRGPVREAETECLLGWLESPGVRLIGVDGTWCSPVPAMKVG